MQEPKNWIQTYSGAPFDFDNPEGHYFNVMDFAHALSMLCRYNGHTKRFYSVGEHLIRCSNLVPEKFAFEALMHDVSEAYMSDMPRPLKNIMGEYKTLEVRIETAIAKQFNLPVPMSPEVKECDNKILLIEREILMNDAPFPWNHYGTTPYTRTEFWNSMLNVSAYTPDIVESKFINRFNELSAHRNKIAA